MLSFDAGADTYLVSTADLGKLGRENQRPVEWVVGVGSPLLARLVVVVVVVGSGALLSGLLLGLGSALGLEPLDAEDLAGAALECGLEVVEEVLEGAGVWPPLTPPRTGKSETTGGRRCGGGAIVGVGGLRRSGHAFGDLIEAVADDLVDLLLACGKVKGWRKSVWWQLSELCADLLSRDRAESALLRIWMMAGRRTATMAGSSVEAAT